MNISTINIVFETKHVYILFKYDIPSVLVVCEM